MTSSTPFLSFVKRPLPLAVAMAFAAGCATTEPSGRSSTGVASPPDAVVGPAGLAGATGEEGARGASDASRAAMSGPAGPLGKAGPAGAAVPAGAPERMVIGLARDGGQAGPAGALGVTGPAGSQGYSIASPVGPAGSTGSIGIRGVMDSIGAEGPTTVGPQGASGLAGGQGPTGTTFGWSAYRDFTFGMTGDDIARTDAGKAAEVAEYMQQNPSASVGIDGSSERRVGRVRSALIAAGVPAARIRTGAFGAPELRRDGRVGVLVTN